MTNRVNRPFLGCTHHEAAAADIIQWSNWEVRKGRTQWLSLLGLVMGVAIVMFVLVMIGLYWRPISAADGWTSSLWRIGGILILALLTVGIIGGIVLSVNQLVRRQTLLITDSTLSFYEVGRWRTYKRQFQKEEVIGLFFAKLESENGHAAEPQLFLICQPKQKQMGKIWQQPRKTRIPLTSWIHTQDQQQLFELLQEIFQRRQWKIAIEKQK